MAPNPVFLPHGFAFQPQSRFRKGRSFSWYMSHVSHHQFTAVQRKQVMLLAFVKANREKAGTSCHIQVQELNFLCLTPLLSLQPAVLSEHLQTAVFIFILLPPVEYSKDLLNATPLLHQSYIFLCCNSVISKYLLQQHLAPFKTLFTSQSSMQSPSLPLT